MATRTRPAKSAAKKAAPDPRLLAGVLAAPELDGPRQVWADALLALGDPRGEFIALQLLSRRSLKGASGYTSDDLSHVPPADREALKAQELALFKKHAKDWVTPVRAAMRGWYWRRGFLDDLTTGPIFFESSAAKTLLATHPVTQLRFEGLTPKAFDRLAKVDFGTVRKIVVHGRQVTSKTARALTGPNLERLTSLVISYSEIGAEGLAALANSHLRGLRHLSISGLFGDAGLEALAPSKSFDSLETLNLIDPAMTDRGLEAFAGAAHFPKLRCVTLELSTYRPDIFTWTRRGVDALVKRFGDAATVTYYGKRVPP